MRFQIEDPAIHELIRTFMVVVLIIAGALGAIFYCSPKQPFDEYPPRTKNLCELEAALYCNNIYGHKQVETTEQVVLQWIQCLEDQKVPCDGLQ